MKTHCLDVLILVLAVIGVTTVTILYSVKNNRSSQQKVSDFNVSCFTPAHFESSHNEFAHGYCKEAYKNGDVYDPYTLGVPPSESAKLQNERPGWKPPNDVEQTDKNNPGSDLKTLLLCEAIVAVMTFILLQMVLTFLKMKAYSLKLNEGNTPDVADKDNKMFHLEEKQDSAFRKQKVLNQMAQTSRFTIAYGIILLVAAIIWFILAAKSHCVLNDVKDEVKPMLCSTNCTDGEEAAANSGVGVFMCDFKVRVLGNVQRYTVQCVASSPPPQTTDAGQEEPAEANTAICFTIACLLLIQLLYTLVVSPMVNTLMVQNGESKLISDVHLYVTVQSL